MLNSKLYDLRDKRDRKKLGEICQDPSIQKVFHSITSDIYALSTIDILVKPPYHCTLIAASLVNENFASLKLKQMAKDILGEECSEAKELSKVKARLKREAKKRGEIFNYEMIPAEILYPYAKKDPEYTMKIWFYFMDKLGDYIDLYNFELSLVPIIVKMRQNGIFVDRKFCRRKLRELGAKRDKCYNEILGYLREHRIRVKTKKLKGGEYESYNPASSKQVQQVISQLNLPINKLTAKGDLATDITALQAHKDHPLIHNQLLCRFYDKQCGTYYGPLYRRYTSIDNPVVHFSFYQSGARTGRFSAELIQTIPKMKEDVVVKEAREVRRAFIAPEGYIIMLADYNQIEMRLFIHYARCESMAEQVLAGYDPHMGTAYDIFGRKVVDKLDEKGRKQFRDAMKDTNFGIIFGMGANKLMSQLSSHDLPTNRNPYEILEDYYRKYPVREFMQKAIGDLYRKGVVTISFDSPLMRFSRDFHVPQHLAYKAVNVIIQSSAAYVMKYGMKRCIKAIARYKLGAKLFMTVHDELGFYIKDDDRKDETIEILKNKMEDHVTFDLPMTVSIKVSETNWGDAKEYKPQLSVRRK